MQKSRRTKETVKREWLASSSSAICGFFCFCVLFPLILPLESTTCVFQRCVVFYPLGLLSVTRSGKNPGPTRNPVRSSCERSCLLDMFQH